VISKQATQEVRDFITDLAWRGAHFDPKRPDFDNSLKVSNDGRNVSMDERMANLDEPLDGGRVDLVATQVARVWDQHRDTVYTDDTGAPQPLPGGLQIIFCDRSTPHQKDGRWSLYEGLREELVARGMPADAIRFIHDYPKPADKAALFRDRWLAPTGSAPGSACCWPWTSSAPVSTMCWAYGCTSCGRN